MALTTYNELKTAIALHAMRSNDSEFVAAVPDFITLFEAEANRRLRLSQQEITTTGSVDANGQVSLPADYLAMRSLRADMGTDGTIEWATPEHVLDEYAGQAAGIPKYFTIEGNILKTYPPSSYDLIMNYYEKIPALTGSNTSNWLLVQAPEAYLYGSLVHGATFMGDFERVGVFKQFAEAAFQDLIKADSGRRFATARMRVMGDTP